MIEMRRRDSGERGDGFSDPSIPSVPKNILFPFTSPSIRDKIKGENPAACSEKLKPNPETALPFHRNMDKPYSGR